MDSLITRFVLYWCRNMAAAWSYGDNWPFFGYSPEEKKQMKEFSKVIGDGEYGIYAMVVAIIAIALIAAVVIPSILALPSDASAVVFFAVLTGNIVISLTALVPFALLITAWFFGLARGRGAVSPEQRGWVMQIFHQVMWQFARLGILWGVIMGIAIGAAAIIFPSGSWFWIVLSLAGQLLSWLFIVAVLLRSVSNALSRNSEG